MDNFAALQWQWEMGITDFVGQQPHDWHSMPKLAENLIISQELTTIAAAAVPIQSNIDLSHVNDLSALRTAIQNFDGLQIKKTATQMVFGEGADKPRVMVIGEAPGADEDRQGRPFVGAAGQLLDKMLAAINLSRETNCYITNVMNWRPPGNRSPTPQEVALSVIFLRKHIAIMQPEFLMIAGGVPAKALFNITQGITRVRGEWMDYDCDSGKKIPAIIMFHPAYLLRVPAQKAVTWQDLQTLQQRLVSPENT
jgi:DNA polymerase